MFIPSYLILSFKTYGYLLCFIYYIKVNLHTCIACCMEMQVHITSLVRTTCSCVFPVCVPCCDVRYDFRMQTMFVSSLPPVVCRRAHVLFTLFVLACAQWCPANIAVCFASFFFVVLVYPMLRVSPDFQNVKHIIGLYKNIKRRATWILPKKRG